MAAQLALKMDINLQDEEPSTMVDEHAHMDAMHRHVKGYKTNIMDLSSWYVMYNVFGYNGNWKREYSMLFFVPNIME